MASVEALQLSATFRQLRDGGTISQFGLPIEERRIRAEGVGQLTAEPDGVRWEDERSRNSLQMGDPSERHRRRRGRVFPREAGWCSRSRATAR